MLAEARRCGAVPFDVPGAALHRSGRLCSFDAVLAQYRIDDAALRLLAAIVRAADSGRTTTAPQSAGLLAVAYGLSRSCRTDEELLRHGFMVYDALYQWCRKAPPGPDFALPRPASPANGWRRTLHQHLDRRHATRALAALNDATVRELDRERAPVERDTLVPRDAGRRPLGRVIALKLRGE